MTTDSEALALLRDAIQLAKTASREAALIPEHHPRHQALARATQEIGDLMRQLGAYAGISEAQLAAMVTAAGRRLN